MLFPMYTVPLKVLLRLATDSRFLRSWFQAPEFRVQAFGSDVFTA